MCPVLMDDMSPQQGSSVGQDSLPPPENKKKMKTLAQRRQSAPSLVISKALTRSRSTSRESCLTPVSPESLPLVQAFLCECPVQGKREWQGRRCSHPPGDDLDQLFFAEESYV